MTNSFTSVLFGLWCLIFSMSFCYLLLYRVPGTEKDERPHEVASTLLSRCGRGPHLEQGSTTTSGLHGSGNHLLTRASRVYVGMHTKYVHN